MESLSSGELVEIFLTFRTDAQDQFEFWLTITFALIVAVTIGKKYVSKALDATASSLYLATTTILLVRYFEDLRNIGIYLAEAESRQLVIFGNLGRFGFYMRLLVFTVGTILTVWFGFNSQKSNATDT